MESRQTKQCQKRVCKVDLLKHRTTQIKARDAYTLGGGSTLMMMDETASMRITNDVNTFILRKDNKGALYEIVLLTTNRTATVTEKPFEELQHAC